MPREIDPEVRTLEELDKGCGLLIMRVPGDIMKRQL